MLHILINTFAFLVAILILVGVHEFGHFIVARWCGVKVIRFSIGFGKPLYRWYDKRGTEYMLAMIPLGGYVKLLDGREQKVLPEQQQYAFDKKPVYQRFAILGAGPLMNIFFAIFAYWLVFSIGITYVKPIVATVVPYSIAAQAGLQTGEEIVAIDGEPSINWAAVVMHLFTHYGDVQQLKMTVNKINAVPTENSHTITLNVQNWQLDPLRPDLLKSLGIKPYKPKPTRNAQGKLQWPPEYTLKQQYAPRFAVIPAIQEMTHFIHFNGVVLYKLITGKISWQSLGGPFSLLQSAGGAAQRGFVVYANFLAFISISIALLNLLPIPGLDGAQLIYLIVEMVTRRPVSVAVQLLTFRLGFILLSIFFLQVLLNDLQRVL